MVRWLCGFLGGVCPRYEGDESGGVLVLNIKEGWHPVLHKALQL